MVVFKPHACIPYYDESPPLHKGRCIPLHVLVYHIMMSHLHYTKVVVYPCMYSLFNKTLRLVYLIGSRRDRASRIVRGPGAEQLNGTPEEAECSLQILETLVHTACSLLWIQYNGLVVRAQLQHDV